MTGYEYEVVGKCPNTGKPFLAPIAWALVYHIAGGGLISRPRPIYPTCGCCNRR